MFRVTFSKFRCWDNLSVEAALGSITLIRGNSGAGKSTIFQGIVWCLYGNVRLVTPNHDPKAKTRVVLEIPYKDSGILIIDRQKNPNRLLITQGGTLYEDTVAQSIIDDYFGSYEIWAVSSYIGQGCRNGFLTASNTGKMEILNKIAFLDDDPSVYIEKIEELLSTTDIEYKSKLAILTANIQKVQTLLQTIDTRLALIPDQITTITDNIATLKKEQLELERIQKQRDIDLGILKDLEMQSIKLDEQLIMATASFKAIEAPKIPSLVPSSIEALMNEIPKLQRRDDIAKNLAQGALALSNYISEGFVPEGSFTIEDYRIAIEKETEIQKQQQMAQSLGVSYHLDTINQTIKKYECVLDLQDRLKIRKEEESLREQINILERAPKLAPIVLPEIVPITIPEPDYEAFRTDKLSELIAELSREKGALLMHIEHLEKGHNVIQCPHCEGYVRYQNGKLLPSESEPTDQDTIREAKNNLQELQAKIVQTQQTIGTRQNAESITKRTYERALLEEQQRVNALTEKRRLLELEQQKQVFDEQVRMDKLATLMDKLKIDKSEPISEDIPEYVRILTPAEIQQAHNIIAKLSTIRVDVPPPISSSKIQMHLKYNELKEQQHILQTTYDEYLQTLPEYLRSETLAVVTTWIQTLRNYSKTTTELTNEINRLNKMKTDLTEQMTLVRCRIGEDPFPKIETHVNQITKLEEQLLQSERAHSALKEHMAITKERDEVVRINETMNDLHVLRQYATETECTILQQITDQLNDSIQSICSNLFDRDISIALSLYKTLKTTKHTKPLVNFNIGYQGGQFDNINQISGGEGDRISLALTLALNRLSMSPLIMLDESLASLDLTMKEMAIRTIREHTNNTVFIIMHDGIEGIFDNVVNIDDI